MAASTGVASGGSQYLEGQPVSLASALVVAVSVGSACLWIGQRLARIEARFDDLACQKNGCPVEHKKGKR